MVTLLLDNGFDIREVREGRKSLVFCALDNGHQEMFDLLVAKGADITRKEDVLLHIACNRGYYDLVVELLKHIDPNRLGPYNDQKIYHNNSAQRYQSNSPLHVAVKTNNIDIAQLLLDHGSNPNIQDDYGRTPLFELQSQEMAQLLLNYHPDLYIKDLDGDYFIIEVPSQVWPLFIHDTELLNSKTSNGASLLHMAIAKQRYRFLGNQIKTITMLLDAGCDLSLTNKKGCTPRAYAIRKNLPDIASLIAQYEDVPIKGALDD